MVQVEVHASMEPPEPEVLIKPQAPYEPLDQIGHPPTPKNPIPEESGIHENFELNGKPVAPKLQQLPSTTKTSSFRTITTSGLPLPRPMPLPDPVSRVPDKPVPFQRLVRPRPLGIRFSCFSF